MPYKTPTIETSAPASRALVVHPHSPTGNNRSGAAMLEEAVGLARAIHLDIVGAHRLVLRAQTPRTLLGAGQVSQLRELAAEGEVQVVIINATLSPTQQRNLEKAIQAKVIDRTALILEIFGDRANTAEGKMQVELAALTYQKSRLVRSWTHLERQRGGFGFLGGPGESQLETDRRIITDRIALIRRQLEEVTRTRALHRKRRVSVPYPLVALVGYTNAGKSTLFNRLSGAEVLAKDMLFATLDPTIRELRLPSGQMVLLSDTVGFISDLPHELVAAFRATLEEVLEADLLVHVRDCSHEDSAAQKNDVLDVVNALFEGAGTDKRPMLEVWNKIDQMQELSALPPANHDEILLSALTGDGCDSLLYAIDRELQRMHFVEKNYILPAGNGKALAWLYRHGAVHQVKTDEDALTLHIQVGLSPADANRFEVMFLAQG